MTGMAVLRFVHQKPSPAYNMKTPSKIYTEYSAWCFVNNRMVDITPNMESVPTKNLSKKKDFKLLTGVYATS
jgi:hypothetical protein